MRFALLLSGLYLPRRLLLLALGILILGLGIGIGGTIGVPGTLVTRANGSTYHACVNTHTAQMRFTFTPGQCTPQEFPISWNQQGAPGVSGYERIQGDLVTVAAGESKISQIFCPTGKSVLGGGGIASHTIENPAEPEPNMFWSYPFSDSSWRIAVHNDTAQSQEIRAYAICANVSP